MLITIIFGREEPNAPSYNPDNQQRIYNHIYRKTKANSTLIRFLHYDYFEHVNAPLSKPQGEKQQTPFSNWDAAAFAL